MSFWCYCWIFLKGFCAFMSLGDLVLELNKLYLIKELEHLFSASFIIGKMYIKIIQKVKVTNDNEPYFGHCCSIVTRLGCQSCVFHPSNQTQTESNGDFWQEKVHLLRPSLIWPAVPFSHPEITSSSLSASKPPRGLPGSQRNFWPGFGVEKHCAGSGRFMY